MTTDYAVNIQSVYRRSLFCERLQGAAWYRDAHDIALELCPDDVWKGAGVIAVLSPRQPWPINVRNARRAVESGSAYGHTPQLHMNQTLKLLERILTGEHPLEVMRGDKTRSFCEAIATCGNGSTATIDRHAHDIAMGHSDFTDKTRKIGKVMYRDMASAYAEVAAYNDLSVNTLQAITWLTWRRTKGVWQVWRNAA